MRNKTMQIHFTSSVSRAFMLGTTLLLAGCSSNVTRFDYPAMGYNSAEVDNTAFSDNFASGSTATSRSQTSRVADSYSSSSSYAPSNDSTSSTDSYNRGNVQSETVRDLSAPSYQPRHISSFDARPSKTVAVASYEQTSAKVGGDSVRVVSGDTLYSISRRYGLKPADFVAENNMSDTTVRIGQVLRVPQGGRSAGVRPSRRVVRATKTAPTFQYASDRNRKAASSHTVQPSETLYSVARKYGVSYVQLASWNGLDQNAGLRVGQVLSLKADANKFRHVAQRKVAPRKSNSNNAGLWSKRAAQAITPKKVQPKAVKMKKYASIKAATKVAPRPKKGGFRWPVRGRIISKFGPMDNGKNNDGVNFAVPMGTQVKAADNGVVAYAGSELKGYGQLVLIRHANNFVSAYAHNSQLKVKRGDRIKRGQVIALAGKSGDVNQPQLHFELRKGSQPIDPISYMAQ